MDYTCTTLCKNEHLANFTSDEVWDWFIIQLYKKKKELVFIISMAVREKMSQ
jgi:hypothetical protein